MNTQPPGRNLLITLVHGTFATGAAWTKDGSILRQQLEQRLGTGLRFSRFDWSGVNSHKARQIAADELASHLMQLEREYPDFQQFLICHSHGGNVALRALPHFDASRTIRGVVTLGTPFITCHRRTLTETTGTLKWAIPLSTVVLWMLIYSSICIGILNILIAYHLWRKLPLWSYILAFFAASLMQIRYISKSLEYLSKFIPAFIANNQDKTMVTLGPPVIQNVRFMCLQVDRDEAGLFLGLLGGVSNIMHVFHAFIRSLAITSFIFGIVILIYYKYNEYKLDDNSPFMAIYITFLLSTVMFVSIVPALGYFPWIIRGHEKGFGGESIFDNMFCRIAVRATPDSVQNWSAYRVIPKTGSLLQHSSFYGDQRICGMIANWIAGADIEGFPIIENDATRKRTRFITHV
jgi:hypothetical protein